MTDVISLLHRDKDGRLFESIDIGPHRLSIQASSYHYCSPKIDGLPAFQYDTFEVMPYNIPKRILRRNPWRKYIREGDPMSNVTKGDLQKIYDQLEEWNATRRHG